VLEDTRSIHLIFAARRLGLGGGWRSTTTKIGSKAPRLGRKPSGRPAELKAPSRWALGPIGLMADISTAATDSGAIWFNHA